MKHNFVNLMHRFPDDAGNATLDEVVAAIAEQSTVADSLDALLIDDNNLIATLRAQIAAIPAIPPAVQTQINAVFDNATALTAKLKKAVTDGTPVSPTA